jgi:hypothetical protein
MYRQARFFPYSTCGHLSVNLSRLSREPRHMIEDLAMIAAGGHTNPPLPPALVRISRIPSCASGLGRHIWCIPLLWSNGRQAPTLVLQGMQGIE